jgi:hypothetical protein
MCIGRVCYSFCVATFFSETVFSYTSVPMPFHKLAACNCNSAQFIRIGNFNLCI